jgi:hypothetical protein
LVQWYVIEHPFPWGYPMRLPDSPTYRVLLIFSWFSHEVTPILLHTGFSWFSHDSPMRLPWFPRLPESPTGFPWFFHEGSLIHESSDTIGVPDWFETHDVTLILRLWKFGDQKQTQKLKNRYVPTYSTSEFWISSNLLEPQGSKPLLFSYLRRSVLSSTSSLRPAPWLHSGVMWLSLWDPWLYE